MTSSRKRLALGVGLGVALSTLVATPAPAVSPGLVVSEVYGGGGNSGAPVNADFVELHNRGTAPASLSGLSLQARAASGSSAGPVLPLSGSVPPGGRYLVQTSTATATGAALPAPDATAAWTLGATGGQVLLVEGTTAFPGTGNLAGAAGLVDMVGWGTTSSGTPAASYETARGATTANATALTRSAAGADTDDNSVDFRLAAPGPQNSGEAPPPPPPSSRTIAEIQGTGPSSPFEGATVSTEGVVTASYPTGGLNGFFLQTAGTGGASDPTPGASDGLFVFGPGVDESTLAIGDSVRVEGRVSEFNGSTQITASTAAAVTELATPLAPVAPQPVLPGSDCALPGADCLTGSDLEAAREAHEGELFRPSGPVTVSDSYDGSPWANSSSSFFGEIGLALESTHPLVQPTEVARADDAAAIAARLAWNEAHRITLDDGASTNYTSNPNLPFPWLTPTNTVRVGAAATFVRPAVLTKSFNQWRLQAPTQVTGSGADTVVFEQDRAAGPADVGGDLTVATFNVLNYFPTTGEEFEASGLGDCTYFTDRSGNRTTVRSCTTHDGGPGPRGAANEESLLRQEAKTVAAINGLTADIVSLEELENSAKFGKDRDFAIGHLVAALNADAGAGSWSYVPSPQPSQRPAVADEDVIRTGFIYRSATVRPAGRSQILLDEVNFDNAREPLAQAFKPVGSNHPGFTVVVNHLKSKGCSGATGENAETIQGCWNADRVDQAAAVAAFAERFAVEHGTEAVFLAGDFNSYTQEDPMQVLYDAGYTAVESATEGEETYSFAGLSGSLDHVLANDAATRMVTGADIWSISSGESVYYEYSRFNSNATNLYAPDPYRSSDHDPELVGIEVP